MKAAETDLAPSERLFVQVGLRVRIRLPPAGSQVRTRHDQHRIFGVMNLGLFNKRYLAAGQYTIADMICYPWASSWATRKIDIEEFPNVKRWLGEIGERPAVKKAMA